MFTCRFVLSIIVILYINKWPVIGGGVRIKISRMKKRIMCARTSVTCSVDASVRSLLCKHLHGRWKKRQAKERQTEMMPILRLLRGESERIPWPPWPRPTNTNASNHSTCIFHADPIPYSTEKKTWITFIQL